MDELEMIKRFSGGVGHDINNVLTGILGFVMLMQDEMEKSSECGAYAEGIRKSALKLQELTRKLLAVNSKRHYNRTDIDPRSLLSEAVRNINNYVDDMDVAVDMDLDERSKVNVDTEKLIFALSCVLAYLRYRTSDTINVRLCGAKRKENSPGASVSGVNYLFSALPKKRLKAFPEDPFDPLYTTASHFLLGCELAVAREIFADHGGDMKSKDPDPGTLSFNAFLPAG